MTFINPKTDYAFKKIFGSSESKDILISFLNAMIYDGNPTIADWEIINPNLPPRVEGLKDTWGGDKEVYEIDCIRVAARIPC